MGEFLGGMTLVGLNLLLVIAPLLLALWLGLRAVRALERSARAHQQIAQRLAELAIVLQEPQPRATEAERDSSRI